MKGHPEPDAFSYRVSCRRRRLERCQAQSGSSSSWLVTIPPAGRIVVRRSEIDDRRRTPSPGQAQGRGQGQPHRAGRLAQGLRRRRKQKSPADRSQESGLLSVPPSHRAASPSGSRRSWRMRGWARAATARNTSSRGGSRSMARSSASWARGSIVKQVDHRGGRRAHPAREDGLLRREQAQGLRLDEPGSGRTAPGDRPACPRFPSASTPSAGSMRTARA